MKYQARITDIKSVEPGYYHVTYEYKDEHGMHKRVHDTNPRTITPFDLQLTHTIRVDSNGKISSPIRQKTKAALAVLISIIIVIALAAAFGEIAIPIAILAFFAFPIGASVHAFIRNRRLRRLVDILTPIDGTIIAYKERIHRSKNHTSYDYYPIIEYQFNGYTFYHVSTNSEEPLHKGESCKMYADSATDTVVCNKDVNSAAKMIFPIVVLSAVMLFFLFAFYCALTNGEVLKNVFSSEENLANILPRIFLIPFGIVWLMLCIAFVKQLYTLKRVNKLIANEAPIPAQLLSEEHYGTATVCAYEYMYRGELRKYSVKYKLNPETLYVDPATGTCYNMQERSRLVLLCFIMGIGAIMFAGMISIAWFMLV